MGQDLILMRKGILVTNSKSLKLRILAIDYDHKQLTKYDNIFSNYNKEYATKILFELSMLDQSQAAIDAVRAAYHKKDDQTPFAVVFLNLQMPAVDGQSVLECLCEIDPGLGIILVGEDPEILFENALGQPLNYARLTSLKPDFKKWEAFQAVMNLGIKPELTKQAMILEKEIQQLHQSETLLKSSRELFYSFLHDLPVPAFLKDLSGRYLHINTAFQSCFKVSADELIGKKESVVWPPEIAGHLEQNDQQALAEGRPVTMSESLRTIGESIKYKITRFPILKKGVPIYLAGIILKEPEGIDIDNLKRGDSSYEFKAAPQTNKNKFLSNIDHEIRTLMNDILGMYDLAMSTDLNYKQREYLNVIRSSAKGLMGFINDILGFMKTDSVKIDLGQLPATLNKVVESKSGGEIADEFAEICVLLVEDHPVNRRVATEIFKNAGLKVDIAINGVEAVEAVRRKKYNAVFMDIQMPEMDGIEATQIIRKTQSMKDLPIIAVTAHVMHRNRQKCFDAGMNDYIAKPIDRKKLLGALRKIISVPVISQALKPNPNPKIEQSPEHTEPEIDNLPGLNVKDGIRRLAGDRELYFDLLVFLCDDKKDFIKNFKGLIAEKDFENATIQAHALKGSAATVAAFNLSAAAKKLEHTCSENDPDTILKTLELVDQELKQIIATSRSISLKSKEVKQNKKSQKLGCDPAKALELLKALNVSLQEYDPLESDKLIKVVKTALGDLSEHGEIESMLNELSNQTDAYDFDEAAQTLELLTPEIQSLVHEQL